MRFAIVFTTAFLLVGSAIAQATHATFVAIVPPGRDQPSLILKTGNCGGQPLEGPMTVYDCHRKRGLGFMAEPGKCIDPAFAATHAPNEKGLSGILKTCYVRKRM
ncbi:hypothetical protein AX17_001615 [Amanita inopinata Kibby_2008]|nr:hypothetical protein AX17_001615 [Amanita inopinata Kibby_2008]